MFPEKASSVDYLTVTQVATRWLVRRSIVYALVAGGHILSIRVGLGRGTIRIAAADVNAYLKKNAWDDVQHYADYFASDKGGRNSSPSPFQLSACVAMSRMCFTRS